MTLAEPSLVFAISKTAFVCAKKDMAVPDATYASLDITVIPIADHVIAALLARPLLAAILRASVHASPISPVELAISAAQDTTNIQNASVRNSR